MQYVVELSFFFFFSFFVKESWGFVASTRLLSRTDDDRQEGTLSRSSDDAKADLAITYKDNARHPGLSTIEAPEAVRFRAR